MLTRNNHSERWLNYCTSLASQTTGAWLLPLRWRQPGDVANCSCQRCKQSQYYSPQRCSDWTHQSRCTGNRYKNIYLSTQWLKSKYSKKNSLLLVIITIKNWQHEIVFFFYLISIYIKKFTFKKCRLRVLLHVHVLQSLDNLSVWIWARSRLIKTDLGSKIENQSNFDNW